MHPSQLQTQTHIYKNWEPENSTQKGLMNFSITICTLETPHKLDILETHWWLIFSTKWHFSNWQKSLQIQYEVITSQKQYSVCIPYGCYCVLENKLTCLISMGVQCFSSCSSLSCWAVPMGSSGGLVQRWSPGVHKSFNIFSSLNIRYQLLLWQTVFI